MATLPDKARLLTNFTRCENREQQYLYMIELGTRLLPLSEQEHDDTHRVAGCQSQVWLVVESDTDGTLSIRGDSDAALVKGLIAVVVLYSGLTPHQVAEFSPRPWFQKLSLDSYLTPSRTQGLEAIIRTIHTLAAKVS